MQLLENQLRAQYRLLKHEGFYTRVRASNEKQESYLYGVDEIIRWARPRSGVSNLYLSRNPFTENGEVAGISGFSIDIDAIREPKDRATTEGEYKHVLHVAQCVTRYLGEGQIATSGNGVLILCPFDALITEDIDGYTRKAQQYERELKKRFETSEVRIDATNYAKAVLRLMGSVNVKDSDSSKWRVARFLHSVEFRAKRSRIREAINGIAGLESGALNPVAAGDIIANLSPEAGSDALAPNSTAGSARLALAESALRRIKPERADSYDDWLRIGIILKEFGPVGFKLWRDWSDASHTKERERYSGEEMLKHWNSFRSDQSITVGTLKYWADQDSPSTTTTLMVPGRESREDLWTPATPLPNDRLQSTVGGISTGINFLDKALNGGYRPGVLYGIYGATNSGKSAYIISALRNVCEGGRTALLVTTEATIEEVCQRYFASGTGIPTASICNGSLTPQDNERLAAYKEAFRNHKLFIRYTSSPKTIDIERDLDNCKPDILLWDYYQKFETTDGNRQTQLAALARWFQNQAIQRQIPVVVGAQLHERSEGTKRLPALKSHLKDCMVLNDEAKVIIVIDWDWSRVPEGDGVVNVKLTLAKNKGPMLSGQVLLDRATTRFTEI